MWSRNEELTRQPNVTMGSENSNHHREREGLGGGGWQCGRGRGKEGLLEESSSEESSKGEHH